VGVYKAVSTYGSLQHCGVYIKDPTDTIWVGYKPTEHKVVIINNYQGVEGCFSSSYLVQLLAGMPLDLSMGNGTSVRAAFDTVIIVTDVPYDAWFHHWNGISMHVKSSIASWMWFEVVEDMRIHRSIDEERAAGFRLYEPPVVSRRLDDAPVKRPLLRLQPW